MTVKVIQITQKKNDEEIINELMIKYHCSLHSCFNKIE